MVLHQASGKLLSSFCSVIVRYLFGFVFSPRAPVSSPRISRRLSWRVAVGFPSGSLGDGWVGKGDRRVTGRDTPWDRFCSQPWYMATAENARLSLLDALFGSRPGNLLIPHAESEEDTE